MLPASRLRLPFAFLELLLRQLLDTDISVLGGTRPNELVEFRLNCGAVPVLGVLDQEHHKERDDGGSRVDDELPGI